MSITVDTAATSKDMTTLTHVKAMLGITTTTDDTLLDALIDQASDLIRKYCGRIFEQETVTETLPGTGTTRLTLERTPIVSVASVKVNNSAITASEFTIEDPDAGLLLRHDDGTPPSPASWALPGRLSDGLSLHLRHQSRSNNVEVKYVGGYKMPKDTKPDFPRDIEQACVDLVKATYLHRQDDPRIRTQKIGDASETLVTEAQLPPAAKDILDRWRRIYLT